MKLLLDFGSAASSEYLFNYSFYTCIIKPLLKNNWNISVIVPLDLYNNIKDMDVYKNIHFLPLNLVDFVELKYTIPECFNFLYSGENKSKYMDNLTKIYKQVVGDIKPDVVINFEFGNCVLRKIFPDSLHLVYLGGVWKSVPPDFSVCMDPLNSVSYSSLVVFRDNIKSFKITDEQNKKIEELKNLFRQKIIDTNIVRKEMLALRKKYKHLILLPLQIQGYMFESECDFKSQQEYFEYVMQRVPKDVGVVVTGHFADISFLKSYVKKHKSKYPNAIVLDKLFKYPPQTSLYVLPYIDGMINVCSSLVLKALLCGVKIFSLGKIYNSWCADFDDIENIDEKLSLSQNNKNNILYWYLTRYDINTESFKADGFLNNYLTKSYQKKGNIDFNYFEEIIPIENVIDYFHKISFNKILNTKKPNLFIRLIRKIFNKG